ncbi:SWIM zinc finger family protein [Flindersiella endophytica]
MSPTQAVPGPWWANRDGEDHRPPAARGPGSRRSFGRTWWGRAWVEALEERAELESNRLSRGRGYARRGTVRELQVAPGVVLARVQGSRLDPYVVTVRVRAFSAEEWDRVFDMIAAQLGRTAALLDGELPPEIVDDAYDAGLSLLPGTGEVKPRCNCPDWADPCKHSAAVCYVIAEALDEDPFALLQLRGRSRDEVLTALRSRRGTAAGPRPAGESLEDQGVVAREAYSRSIDYDLPHVSVPPPKPGRPAALGVPPPAESGISAEALATLATDAAERAWALATGEAVSCELTYEQDAARRAVELLGTHELSEAARHAGVPARELTGWAIAWKFGGAGGVDVLREPWDPDSAVMSEAAAALASAYPGEDVRVESNRLTCGKHQLRLGHDSQWYPFVKSFGAWDLAGAPASDPASALAALRAGPQ